MAKRLENELYEQPKRGFLNRMGGAFSGMWDYVKYMSLITAGVFSIGLGVAGCKPFTPIPEPNPTPTNSAPQITSTPVIEVNEGDFYNYNIIAFDPDGDSLAYSLPISPDWVSISSGKASGPAPKVNSDTRYNMEIGVSDGINPLVTQSYVLTVKNIPDSEPPVPVNPPVGDYVTISGRLEDCENDETGRQGIARVYDTNTVGASPIIIKSAANGTVVNDSYGYGVETDATGNFSITLEKLVDNSDEIYLQAGTTSSRALTSYVRTINLPAKDANLSTGSDPRASPAIRVMLNTDLSIYGITKEDFKKSINYLNAPLGLFKYDIQNIEIVDADLGDGSFSNEEINKIYNKILDPNDIGGYVKERVLNVQRDDQLDPSIKESKKHYDSEGNSITQKWAVISRNNNLPEGWQGSTDTIGSGIPMTVGMASIWIKTVDDTVISHELGHALALRYDYTASTSVPPTLSGDRTVMDYDFTPITASFADKKAARVVYEDTYLAGESLDNIMRLDWGFSSP